MEKYCPKCNAYYGATEKNFCTQDGTKLIAQNPMKAISDEISVIKNKIIWNVPVGEVAYRISEKEMDSLLGASGIVVNEGVTAYIYFDGQLAAELHGGTYDFINKEELERKLNARFGGMADRLKNIWKVVTRFWVGTTLNERMGNSNESFEKFTSIEELISYCKGDAICSVVLKLDREFPLVFTHDIKTSQYTGKIGVQVLAQITNFSQFIQYFFVSGGGSKQNVSNIQIKDLFQHDVAECLRYVRMENGTVSEEETQKFLHRLQGQIAMNNTGISITNIKDCSITSEDLGRLQDLDREIYLSEQELTRLHKINIIKNRLSDYDNQQLIEQARGELGIRIAMDEINRDKIIADEDLLKFKETIIYARRLREAENQEDLDAALSGIYKSQLLRKEEIDFLQFETAEKRYRRETAFSLMQLGDTLKRNKIIQEAEQDNELSTTKHQIGLERIKDIYRDEQFRMQMSHQREELKLQEEADMAALRTYKSYKNIKEEQEKAEHDRQIETLRTIHEHEESTIRIKATMSAEQLTAEQLARLTPEAQAEYMKAIGAQQRLEAEKEKSELIMQLSREERERSERESQRIMEHVERIASASRIQESERANEYKNNLHRTEDRLDRQQEQVMRYTVGNPRRKENTSYRQTTTQQHISIPIDSSAIRCPNCGKENDLSEGSFCAYCRTKLS